MKILFVHNYPPGQLAPFVQTDLNILRERYDVEEFSMLSGRWQRGPLTSPRAWWLVSKFDLVYGWFGICAPFILMAKLLGKAACFSAGGSDIVNIPEIGYGLGQLKPRRRWLMMLGYKLADRVLIFSKASRLSLEEQSGIRSHNLMTVYLGVDIDYFTPIRQKKTQALTVSYITKSNLLRKGINTFVEAANYLPETPFRLAGKIIDSSAVEHILNSAPKNFTFLGELSQAQLRTEYQQAQVYAQLSWHEGFGMALAEAMACGCIPLVTRNGSLPEIVGDTGFYVPLNDAQAAAEACRQAFQPNNRHLSQLSRERIADCFPIQKRKQSLYEIIEDLYSRKRSAPATAL